MNSQAVTIHNDGDLEHLGTLMLIYNGPILRIWCRNLSVDYDVGSAHLVTPYLLLGHPTLSSQIALYRRSRGTMGVAEGSFRTNLATLGPYRINRARLADEPSNTTNPTEAVPPEPRKSTFDELYRQDRERILWQQVANGQAQGYRSKTW